MRERLHILLCETRELPTLDPGPCSNVSHRVLSSTVACQIISLLAREFPAQMDLQYPIHSQCLVSESGDRVWDLFLCEPAEVIGLALVRRSGTVMMSMSDYTFQSSRYGQYTICKRESNK